MFVTVSIFSLFAMLFFVLCALVCTGILIRKVKRGAAELRRADEEFNAVEARRQRVAQDLQSTKADLRINVGKLNDAEREINGLKQTIKNRDAEVERLSKLVTAAEKTTADLRTSLQTATDRADAEQIFRINMGVDLAKARKGEDPETDSFYRHGADVAPESESGAAAEPAAAAEVTEAAPAKPKKKKKPAAED